MKLSDRVAEDKPRLLPQHLADLRASGLTDNTIRACEFRSENNSHAVVALLGNYLSVRSAAKFGPCLVIPYYGSSGVPLSFLNGDGKAHPFVRLKPDKPRTDKGNNKRKVKYESPIGTTCHAYFPPGTRAALSNPSVPLIITEGEKKAASADQCGLPCIGLGGVWSWQVRRPKDKDGKGTGPRELIPDLSAVVWAGRRVTIAFDSDIADKPKLKWGEWYLAELLSEAGADVRVIRLPRCPDSTKVGLDDFLIARGTDSLQKLLHNAAPPARPVGDDDRPTIVIGTDEFRVNLEAIASLADARNVYQRGGFLVHVIKSNPDPEPTAVVRRPPGLPVVRNLSLPLLREQLTRHARWFKRVRGADDVIEERPAHPPGWSVNAIQARGNWPNIRYLEAVVNHPVLLPGGTIHSTNGYDSQSQLLVTIPPNLRLSVHDQPTRNDVLAAVEIINDVLSDFPFERPEHRSAWFAGLLTPLAWFAFEGPAPLLLIDGNVRGVGKGLLADVIALILTGRRFPVMSYTSDKEELRKKITSLAMEGERLVLLDNLAGAVGNDVLDMALTADRWKDRVLGVNQVYDGPLNVCWFATGNNVQLHADTARRCSHCRIETQEERPELQSGFKYPNLRRHIREMRGVLLSAALTLLRGWYVAGKPQHGLKPWGSFEGWSGIVREAVVFAGLPDPGETRLALQTSADRDAIAMTAVIDALERMTPDRRGMTTAEIIDTIRNPTDPPPEWHADLKSAVEELCGKLDGRTLGYRFRHFTRRNFGGRMIDKATSVSTTNSVRWAVLTITNASGGKPSPASPALPGDSGTPPTGDAGDAGDVPAPPKSCGKPISDDYERVERDAIVKFGGG